MDKTIIKLLNMFKEYKINIFYTYRETYDPLDKKILKEHELHEFFNDKEDHEPAENVKELRTYLYKRLAKLRLKEKDHENK